MIATFDEISRQYTDLQTEKERLVDNTRHTFIDYAYNIEYEVKEDFNLQIWALQEWERANFHQLRTCKTLYYNYNHQGTFKLYTEAEMFDFVKNNANIIREIIDTSLPGDIMLDLKRYRITEILPYTKDGTEYFIIAVNNKIEVN